MSWKDDYRDEKEASGLTWDEFHEKRFVHVDDIAAAELAEIREHLDAVRNEYRDLKRELFEVRAMLESDEFDP
jgi:hypothetical protein